MAVLGVLKAGGAFVPLDPTHPESRLQFLVHSVQANIMLCARDRVDKLSNVAEHIVPLDDEALIELAPAVDTSVLSPEVRESNAAYVIFTSGSTGEPKVSTTQAQIHCRECSCSTGNIDGTQELRG